MKPGTEVRQVPLLNVREQTREVRAELDAAIARVLDHGQFIQGPEVRELERQIAALCGTRFAVGCASGSDALLLALMAVGTQPGGRVITTPYSFFATASSITRLGAVPMFVDIEPETFNIDPGLLRTRLTELTPAELSTVRAIMPVHLFGQCADVAPISDCAKEFGIPVIEDAAQAIGSTYRDLGRAGSFGLAGCFSFFPSKNLGGLGDGGMITTDDEELAVRLRLLRDHGAEHRYYHRVVGINSRLDTLQAAALLVKLSRLEEWTERRIHNAVLYDALLEGVTLPARVANCRHIYNQYVVRVPRRDSVRQQLADAGVATAIYYPVPLHLQECFAYLGYKKGDFPHSEVAAESSLALPIGPELTQADVEYVAEALASAIAAPSAS